MGTEGWESACWHQTQRPISLSNFSSHVPKDMEAQGTRSHLGLGRRKETRTDSQVLS